MKLKKTLAVVVLAMSCAGAQALTVPDGWQVLSGAASGSTTTYALPDFKRPSVSVTELPGNVGDGPALMFLGNPGQGKATVESFVEDIFETDVNFVADAEGKKLTFSSVKGFDYLAIHLGGAELLFSWAGLLNGVVLSGIQAGDVSSYRAYIHATPLPGAIWLFGSALLGFIGVSSRRKA